MDEIQLAKEIRSAIKGGDSNKALSLIGSDKSRLNMSTPFGTWVHVAARHGQLEILKQLVAMDANINAVGGISEGKPINEAAVVGNLDIVEYLISLGADLDVTTSENNPLFSAIYGGHVAVARLLIDSGIDTTIKYTGEYMQDMDALAFARERGQTDLIDLLKTRQKSK